jgi:two-component system cell cycle response regulator CpdR
MGQEPSIPPLKVLYIEDNPLVREITCELLSDGSREVTAVATGEEGLSAVFSRRFDIVVTDVSLPAMSGLEFARQVKLIDPAMPIILASGYPLNAEDCRLGANVKTITKPFNPPDLDSLIQELCG